MIMKTLVTKGNWTVEYKEVENGYNVEFLFKKDNKRVCFDSGFYKTLEEAKKEAIVFVDYYSAL